MKSPAAMQDDPPLRSRGKPVNVYTTDTAEWDIVSYQVPRAILRVIAESLAGVPVSERDVVEGTIRYRQFGDWVAVFHYTSTSEEFIVDVCGIRPPAALNKSEEFLKKLARLAMLRGATGI